LREHPDIWLPPQKELHYFDHQKAHGWLSRKNLRQVKVLPQSLLAAIKGKQSLSQELAWQARYYIGARTDSWYLSLFKAETGLLTGALEPSYVKLSPEQILHVAKLMPDVKLIYMMRDPIERSWSSITRSTAKNKKRPMSEVSEQDIQLKMERSTLYLSNYIEHIERWEAAFPGKDIFFGYLEDMDTKPSDYFDQLCEYLQIDAFPAASRALFDQAVNHTHGYKVEIPAPIERILAENLIAPTEKLAKRFGGRTNDWLTRMKTILSRPW
jgi:hypothetical protein